MTIAEKAAKIMREHGISSVMWGDGFMTDLGSAVGYTNEHPLDCMTKMCRALRRAPKLFEHSYVHGHDSRGYSRLVCSYKLK